MLIGVQIFSGVSRILHAASRSRKKAQNVKKVYFTSPGRFGLKYRFTFTKIEKSADLIKRRFGKIWQIFCPSLFECF
jgi:hypothetical protein